MFKKLLNTIGTFIYAAYGISLFTSIRLSSSATLLTPSAEKIIYMILSFISLILLIWEIYIIYGNETHKIHETTKEFITIRYILDNILNGALIFEIIIGLIAYKFEWLNHWYNLLIIIIVVSAITWRLFDTFDHHLFRYGSHDLYVKDILFLTIYGLRVFVLCYRTSIISTISYSHIRPAGYYNLDINPNDEAFDENNDRQMFLPSRIDLISAMMIVIEYLIYLNKLFEKKINILIIKVSFSSL